LFHLWVIALFMAIVWRDMIDRPLAGADVATSHIIAGTLAPMLLVVLVVRVLAGRAVRGLETTGAYRAIRIAESALGASRWAAVAAYAFGVIVLGWLDVVRSVTGDLVLVDELLAMSPAFAVFIAGWWCVYPIERMIREATMYRSLHAEADESVLYQVPTRLEFILLNVRHQLLLTMTPLLMLSGWAELVNLLDRHTTKWAASVTAASDSVGAVAGGWEQWLAARLVQDDVRLVCAGVLQFLGIVSVLIFAPALMRVVWDTVRLGEGEVRRRLLELCRSQRIRVRDILVWRTHGTLMNGAVMGLIPRVRYVMLTDVMLDMMPTRELEAVMAHELAHVKHRHIIWLGLTLMVSVTVAASAAGFVMFWALGIGMDRIEQEGVIELAVTGAGLVMGFTVFGFVSRRFEWQADAFAAKCLSEQDAAGGVGGEGNAGRVTAEGVSAMISALELVARLNHIPREASSWRHGSISVRQARLAKLTGAPLDRMPADRTPRIIKRVVGAIVAAFLVLTIVQLMGGTAA